MVVSWHNPDAHYDSLILAGDVGGTNTNLAIVGESNGVFTIILEVFHIWPLHESLHSQ